MGRLLSTGLLASLVALALFAAAAAADGGHTHAPDPPERTAPPTPRSDAGRSEGEGHDDGHDHGAPAAPEEPREEEHGAGHDHGTPAAPAQPADEGHGDGHGHGGSTGPVERPRALVLGGFAGANAAILLAAAVVRRRRPPQRHGARVARPDAREERR